MKAIKRKHVMIRIDTKHRSGFRITCLIRRKLYQKLQQAKQLRAAARHIGKRRKDGCYHCRWEAATASEIESRLGPLPNRLGDARMHRNDAFSKQKLVTHRSQFIVVQ